MLKKKALMALLLLISLCLCSCSAAFVDGLISDTEKAREELAESNYYEYKVSFTFSDASDKEVLEKRLDLFNIKIAEKEEKGNVVLYILHAPLHTPRNLVEMLFQNYKVELSGPDDVVAIDFEKDVVSADFQYPAQYFNIQLREDFPLENYFTVDEDYVEDVPHKIAYFLLSVDDNDYSPICCYGDTSDNVLHIPMTSGSYISDEYYIVFAYMFSEFKGDISLISYEEVITPASGK